MGIENKGAVDCRPAEGNAWIHPAIGIRGTDTPKSGLGSI